MSVEEVGVNTKTQTWSGRQVPMPKLLLGHLLVLKQGQGQEHELILVPLLVQRRVLVVVLGQEQVHERASSGCARARPRSRRWAGQKHERKLLRLMGGHLLVACSHV